MYYYEPYFEGKMDGNMSILDFKRGDVNGDRVKENIYLIGERPASDSPFTKNITLVIEDRRLKTFTRIPLKENAGYNPTIFLGDFTKDKTKDILVSIDSGGSGGYAFYYIFSYINNVPKNIFDAEEFSQKYQYEVKYKDFYRVEIDEKGLPNQYVINIEYKGKDYLSEIYNENGTLKEPINGWVNPLGGLYPIDFQRDGTYEIYAERSIAGRYNADSLGYVQTSLEWNGKEFIPFFQTVGVLG